MIADLEDILTVMEGYHPQHAVATAAEGLGANMRLSCVAFERTAFSLMRRTSLVIEKTLSSQDFLPDKE